MQQLRWKLLAGQDRIKEVLTAAFMNGTLGHAYLFCGETGTGTFAAALELAMALLCRNEEFQPCGTCSGCSKVRSFSHPDFHVVMPLSLQKEHKGSDGKITEAGWSEFSERVKQRIENPYLIPEFSTLPSIPVDWIREVTHAIHRGTVEKGKNIVLLDGVEIMQQESANAMLKTLEEPPEDTLLILCTDRVHAVLPTIMSRCQLLRFGALPPDLIKHELIERYAVPPDDLRLSRASGLGSLGRAFRMLQQSPSDEAGYSTDFWRYITEGDMTKTFEKIDEISGSGDYGTYEALFVHLLNGIRNSFFIKIDTSGNYILGDAFPGGALSGITSPNPVEELMHCCETAISSIRARANISLVLTNFAITVMEILHVKKQ
jgi:DNA polymerase III delta' subunit